MTSLAAETVGERLAGRQPTRTRAVVASTVVAVGAWIATYKLLHS